VKLTPRECVTPKILHNVGGHENLNGFETLRHEDQEMIKDAFRNLDIVSAGKDEQTEQTPKPKKKSKAKAKKVLVAPEEHPDVGQKASDTKKEEAEQELPLLSQSESQEPISTEKEPEATPESAAEDQGKQAAQAEPEKAPLKDLPIFEPSLSERVKRTRSQAKVSYNEDAAYGNKDSGYQPAKRAKGKRCIDH
jgi:hypothetical protein